VSNIADKSMARQHNKIQVLNTSLKCHMQRSSTAASNIVRQPSLSIELGKASSTLKNLLSGATSTVEPQSYEPFWEMGVFVSLK